MEELRRIWKEKAELVNQYNFQTDEELNWVSMNLRISQSDPTAFLQPVHDPV